MTDEEEHQLAFSPQIDDDGTGYVVFQWGDQSGAFTPDGARRAALALLESAADADMQAAMWAWLSRDPGSTPEGVARVMVSFRQHRDQPEPFTPGQGVPLGDPAQ